VPTTGDPGNFRGASTTIRPVLQHVAAQGYAVELAAGSGHWKVSDPGTEAFLCALPHTPSSRQAAARANSVLRWAGISPMPPVRPRKGCSAVETSGVGEQQTDGGGS